jgi:hypothetical protein
LQQFCGLVGITPPFRRSGYSLLPIVADRGLRASFERIDGATCGFDGWTLVVGALIRRARGETFLASSAFYINIWRGGGSPGTFSMRTRRLMNTFVCWATARSPVAGCGADHDRLSSLHRRSSWMSRWRC